MKQITNRLYQISLGAVNAFVVEDDGLTLVDTGLPGSTDKIFAALQKEGKNPADIKRIILTHLHTDHAGNAADIKQRVNARVYAHREDARLLEQGVSDRPMTLTPGITNKFIYQLFIKSAGSVVRPVAVEEKLSDGDVIPLLSFTRPATVRATWRCCYQARASSLPPTCARTCWAWPTARSAKTGRWASRAFGKPPRSRLTRPYLGTAARCTSKPTASCGRNSPSLTRRVRTATHSASKGSEGNVRPTF